jgi:hypothetical protein
VVPFPMNVASEPSVGIAIAGGAHNGEDVAALTERGCDLERLRDSVRLLLAMRMWRSRAPGRRIRDDLPTRETVSRRRSPRR